MYRIIYYLIFGKFPCVHTDTMIRRVEIFPKGTKDDDDTARKFS
jgi:hypothetical protein